MKRQTRSILEEINAMSAEQVIVTAINLMELITETFDAQTAADLNKRLINSIKTKDPRKFARGVSKIEDPRHTRR
jgi:hypothetical protein